MAAFILFCTAFEEKSPYLSNDELMKVNEIRELRTLKQRHLRIILNIKWDDFISNEEVLRRANVRRY